jgi:tRNA A37 methylthiotransferase MiaB
MFSGSTSKAGIEEVPTLKEFLKEQDLSGSQEIQPEEEMENLPDYLQIERAQNRGRTYFIETHGCQMNVADSEIVETVLDSAGYSRACDAETADVLLLNTCAIREGAEKKIWNKLRSKYDGFKKRKPAKVIGMLGCMAERLKEKVLEEKLVDIVAGPDAYRDIPRLIKIVNGDGTGDRQQAMNVQLSLDETYADIIPVRKDVGQNHHAWISIMRGCNNMCAFCIVPFTRGRERSRPVLSIEDEVKYLRDAGIKEVTLLG